MSGNQFVVETATPPTFEQSAGGPVQVVEVYVAGEKGPRGPEGGAVLDCLAAEAVGGHRMVVVVDAGTVGYADHSIASHAHRVVGLTLSAAVAGDMVPVQSSGEVTEPSWNWQLGAPVFLSTNGLLTQTPPATGFLLIVGIATAPTKLLIAIKQPIVKE